METIGWGIIGAGAMAGTFAEDFRYVPRAELRAVASRSAERASAFAARHHVAKSCDYEELLADPEIDVVYIATPHPHHRDIALAAIAHNKAVLIEKSFTATLAGTQEVVRAARSAGVFCMEAMWTRFLPAVAAAREIVAWGRIGEVCAIQGDLAAFRTYDPSNRLFDPETGGGAILDLGVYLVSFAQAFLGEAKRVDCIARPAPNGVDMAATITLEHANAGHSSLTCGFDMHGPGRMEIFGTKGWVEVEPRFHHPNTISVHRSGMLPRIVEAKYLGRGYSHEIAEVTEAVRAGLTESATMPLSDTVEVMRILEECLSQAGIEHQEAAVVLTN